MEQNGFSQHITESEGPLKLKGFCNKCEMTQRNICFPYKALS